jgi:transposase
MSEVTIIGIDLAKRVFQLHGACANGAVIFRKKLTRVQLLAFMSQQSACVVAMEACATAHSWGREIEKLRLTVRLIALKSEAQQARAMLFRTRQMFIGQRTQTINALRGHLAEHGVVAPKGSHPRQTPRRCD